MDMLVKSPSQLWVIENLVLMLEIVTYDLHKPCYVATEELTMSMRTP